VLGLAGGLVLALAVLLLTSAPAQARFEQGQAAAEAGDLAGARGHWLQAAEAGDARAMTALAELFDDDDPTQAAAAAAWLHRAAERGFALAQTRLAVLHLSGRGVERDPAVARRTRALRRPSTGWA
jgi:TPR repeat protein